MCTCTCTSLCSINAHCTKHSFMYMYMYNYYTCTVFITVLACMVYIPFSVIQIALLQSMWATNQCQLITTEANPGTDDDTSLYRLFGFSMFVSIQFRKRVWFGRLRKRYTYEHRCAMRREYTLLTLLVESDKSVLPACIKFQDRGKMTFPHHSFLPFARACSKSIKTYLNDNAYKRHGRHVVQVISVHG